MSLSKHTLSRLVAISGLASAVGLVGHVAVSPPPTSFVSIPALETVASHHDALLTSAWLQTFGAMLLVVTLLGILELASSGSTLAGRILLLAGSGAVALSLLVNMLLIGAAQLYAAGNLAMAAVALQLANAADYSFPLVNLFWVASLGVIVLRSRILPSAFGYAAVAIAAVDLVGGVAALYSDAVNAVINPFFIVLVLWIVAAAIVLLVHPRESTRETTLAPRSASGAA